MKTVSQRLARIIILTTVIMLTISACAHRPPTPQEQLQDFVRDAVRQLKLDAPQKEKLDLLAKALRSAIEKSQSEGGPLLDKLIGDIASARWDESFITLLQDLQRLMTDEVGPEVIKSLVEFYASLSWEQKGRFTDWLKGMQK